MLPRPRSTYFIDQKEPFLPESSVHHKELLSILSISRVGPILESRNHNSRFLCHFWSQLSHASLQSLPSCYLSTIKGERAKRARLGYRVPKGSICAYYDANPLYGEAFRFKPSGCHTDMGEIVYL